jgi:hypothetical protein
MEQGKIARPCLVAAGFESAQERGQRLELAAVELHQPTVGEEQLLTHCGGAQRGHGGRADLLRPRCALGASREGLAIVTALY